MLQVKRSVVVLEEDYPLNFVTYFYEANSQDNLKIIKKKMESLEVEALFTSVRSYFATVFFQTKKGYFRIA